MLEPRFIGLILALLTLAACSSATLPTLSPPAPASVKEAAPERGVPPTEATIMVPGSPTDVYALVARGAHRCWLGADGPLKTTHVFHAEAESPAKGGAAEMVLHERDETLRDKRGARAFRVVFSAEPGSTSVVISVPKMDRQFADVMVKDAQEWARGGTACGLRAHVPPVLTPVVGGSAAPSRR